MISIQIKDLKNQIEKLHDPATGWMLREVGKKDENQLISFLDKNAHIMPRVMLRYSIEKFPKEIRKKYLQQKFNLCV